MKKTRTLSLPAMLAATELVILLIASVLPTVRLSLVAIAGTVNIITLLECGKRYTLIVFAAVSILSAILLPLKLLAVLYIAFFGYYPLVKSYLEKLGRIKLEWLLKILILLIALTITLLLYRYGFAGGIELFDKALWLIYTGCLVVFVVYDLALTRLVQYYLNRKRH
jgi:hypothetical protein